MTAPAPETLVPDTLRERKKRSTRRALRLAALTLVAERGLDGVTTDEIAAAADVSPRTFFNYFAGKEDALVGNDPEVAGQLAAELAARPATEAPLEALRAVLEGYAATVSIDERVWELRMRVLEAHPHLRAALAGASLDLDRALTQAVATRMGVPTTDLFPALVVTVATAAARTALWHSGTTQFARTFAEVADEAFDALASGLQVPPARR